MVRKTDVGMTPEFGAIYRVGDSFYGCGDLVQGHAMTFYEHIVLTEQFVDPVMLYCDPPWGQSNASNWIRKARIYNPDMPQFMDFPDVMIAVAQVAEYIIPRPVMIEMGRNWKTILTEALAQFNLSDLTWVDITYQRSKPCLLCHATPAAIANGLCPDGMDDIDTPAWAIENYSEPGDVVFDVTCGQGWTGKVAFERDRHFMGFEMNTMRLGRAMDIAIAHYGVEAEQIGWCDGRA